MFMIDFDYVNYFTMRVTELKDRLNLLATAVGSLPYNNPQEAIDLIFRVFPDFPVLPTLSNVNPKEDMLAQPTQRIPGIIFDEADMRWYFDQNYETFYEELEEFYLDYESIVNEGNLDLLDKYAISGEFSSTFPLFIEKIKEIKPVAIKGQVIGPFSWGTSLIDREKKCAFYDDTAREIIIKGLTLKALWQVKIFKEASPESIPVIFLDEPTMSQYGTSAFITVKRSDIVNSISEIAEVLKQHGALVGVHCCGKTDWSLITGSNVNILNFDGFYFAESLSLYSKDIENFLENNGYIAWGITPTLDEDALKEATVKSLAQKFDEAIAYLINKGIDKKFLLKSSFITPTCGAGSLNIELAQKAMELNSGVAKYLKEKYSG